MKKIIALFILMFAFTFNATAQENSRAQELAKNDTHVIAEYLSLKGDVLTDLQAVFLQKHNTLSNEGLSEERKIVLSRFVETKLEALLSNEQIAKLKLDANLYKKLTQN